MNARRYGITSRLVDETLQHLFIFGEVAFTSKYWNSHGVDERISIPLPLEDLPNQVAFQMFLDVVKKRLELEHGIKTVTGVQDGKKTLCNYLPNSHTLLLRNYEPYTQREKMSIRQEVQHYRSIDNRLNLSLSRNEKAEYFRYA